MVKEPVAMVRRAFRDFNGAKQSKGPSPEPLNDLAWIGSAALTSTGGVTSTNAERVVADEGWTEWQSVPTMPQEEWLRLLEEQQQDGVVSVKLPEKFQFGVKAEERFNQLKAQWIKEQATSSRLKNVVHSIPYQEIIGMGREALPFLISEIQTSPYYWFWALERITRENPAAEATTHEEMVAAWLVWARKNV